MVYLPALTVLVAFGALALVEPGSRKWWAVFSGAILYTLVLFGLIVPWMMDSGAI